MFGEFNTFQSMSNLFEQEWCALAERLSLSQKPTQRWLEELSNCYREPQRHYHDISHIADLLRKFRPLANHFVRPDEALAALYFHDSVYVIGALDNEARSADLSTKALTEQKINPDGVKRIAAMIEATASHKATEDADTNLFLDLDMSILAAPHVQYKTYAQNVMAEFTTVYSQEDYVAGRISRFLEPTLSAEKLFLTDHYRDVEQDAQENMRWEVQWLETGKN